MEQAREAVATGRLLDLKNDIVFKSFFSKESEESKFCRRRMISAVIGRQVVEATVQNPEILPEYFVGKAPRLDIHCKLDDGSEVDVELQQSKNDDNQQKRAVFYAARLMSGTLGKGKRYSEIPHVYQIMFTDFTIVDDVGLHHKYLLHDTTYNHVLTDCLQIHFIELPKLKALLENPPETLSEAAFWSMIIAMGDSPAVQDILHKFPDYAEDLSMANTLLNTLSRDEKEWYRQLAYEEGEIEYGARMASATEAGLTKGIAIGEERGRAEGSRAAKLEAARNLISLHFLTDEQIAQTVGLSLDEIQKIR